MDPHSSGQVVPRCDLCESARVHSYCDFCHVNLCTPCIGKHISDGYDKHKIVPFQERRSTLIHPKCGTHQNRNCELQCKDCNVFVCSSSSASKQHTGHSFVEVTEFYDEKKDTKELENHTSQKPKNRGVYSLFRQITPLSTATKENVLSLNQLNISVRELLDIPEIVTTIQTGHILLRNVTFLNKDEIWTSGLTSVIKCFNIKGVLIQTIRLPAAYLSFDIAKGSDGDLLYVDRIRRTVNKVKNGETKLLITLQCWVPLHLCVTSTGDLLVTMRSDDNSQSKVVRYSGNSEIQTIQYGNNGYPLYSRNNGIKFITENRNRDICVAEFGDNAVVVVNHDGKLRWRYTGHPSVNNNNNKRFDPRGITTDSQSRVLTTDRYNNCIHILDQYGQFLRYIYRCHFPFDLCIDNDDNLFVCECAKGSVKKIKYLRYTSSIAKM